MHGGGILRSRMTSMIQHDKLDLAIVHGGGILGGRMSSMIHYDRSDMA